MRDRIELPLEVAWDRDTDASAVELHTVALFSSPYPVWLESFLFGAPEVSTEKLSIAVQAPVSPS